MRERRRHRSLPETSLRGIAAELGVYDDVFLCLSPGEPWLEHGIVEHRYKELRPTVYREMINRWGHVIQGPRRYSVTAFLTRRWSQLAINGVLSRKSPPITTIPLRALPERYSLLRARGRFQSAGRDLPTSSFEPHDGRASFPPDQADIGLRGERIAMEHKVFLFGDAAQARTLARYRSLMRSTVAPLLLRLVLAVAFVGHGAQKLFGWVGGAGVGGPGRVFHSGGLPPGGPLALLLGVGGVRGGGLPRPRPFW